jgi:hypothetical protein
MTELYRKLSNLVEKYERQGTEFVNYAEFDRKAMDILKERIR